MKINLRKKESRININKLQKGFTLLEVLISMLIGLFLLVGITTSYVSSKKSSQVRSEISILEDNGRAALEILAESLQHVGYRSTEIIPFENPFVIETPTTVSCAAGVANIKNTYHTGSSISNNTTNGDTIGVMYLGDSDLRAGCSGVALADECLVGEDINTLGHRIYNTFFVNNNAELQCGDSLLSENGGVITIAEGVENMQILYGLDLDNDSYVERYVNSGAIGNDWGLVVSLQIAILVRASNETKTTAEALSYSLLDIQIDSPSDRYERAVFSTSINLRNL